MSGQQTAEVMESTVGQLREADLLEAGRLMYRSMNYFRKRAGMPQETTRLRRPVPLLEHIYNQSPGLSWGAYHNGKLVGFLASHIRDLQWYIAYIFVDPLYHDQGIGRQLVEAGIEEARRRDMRFLSGCTFSYNTRAIGLLSHCGLYPRKNIMRLQRPARCKLALPPRTTTVEIEAISNVETVAELNRLDCEVRGANRSVDHCYWLADNNYKGYIFTAGGRTAGYAYITLDGHIGPVLAARDTFLTDILNHCLHELVQFHDGEIDVWINGKNFGGLRLLLETGFRYGEIAVLMTNRIFCDLRRYLPHSMAVF